MKADVVNSQADWRGSELAGRAEWRLALGPAERAEVGAALRAAEGVPALRAAEEAGTAPGEIARDRFPLPGLGPRLAGLARELAAGRGFCLLEGVPVTGLSERQAELVSLGIAAHVGEIVPQGGVPLRHVRDEGADPAQPGSRSYQHRHGLGYHADPSDIVALLCLRPAKSGGLSSIVSTAAVHNEIVRTRPDLAEVLYAPWWHDRRTGDGPERFYQRPVYEAAGGTLVTHYGPDYMRSAYLRSAQRDARVPPLSAAQLEAMARLDRLNDDPRFALVMDLQAGDMQFLNNHVILHRRTAYEHDPEPQRRRDLIRLWLAFAGPAT